MAPTYATPLKAATHALELHTWMWMWTWTWTLNAYRSQGRFDIGRKSITASINHAGHVQLGKKELKTYTNTKCRRAKKEYALVNGELIVNN